MRESRRLPESELDIMLVVWKEGGDKAKNTRHKRQKHSPQP